MSSETIFVIRPHKTGWQCVEAPGVQPWFDGADGRRQAVDYAKGRTAHRGGEIRIYNANGDLEETMAFDDRTRRN